MNTVAFQPAKKSQAGCLILFSLPFALVGLAMAGVLAWSFWDYTRMQSWEQVPAIILKAELESHRGDDSTSYKATASYSYEYNGNAYTGDRVALHTMSDNIGSYQQDINKTLQEHLRSGEPIPCYVNQSAPEESVLFPELRWEMLLFIGLFAVVFGGVGFGLMAGTIYAFTSEQQHQKLAVEHPEEPWAWKEDWVKGQIRDSNLATLIGVAAFAALWNVISFPIAGLMVSEMFENGNWLIAIALLFPLIGVGLLAWAGYLFMQYRKYGESVFEMAEIPGVIGGKLAGVIRSRVHMQPDEGFLVRLTCVQQRTEGSGKNRRTVEDILWQDDRVVHRSLTEDDFSQTVIPVLFGIPYTSTASTTSLSEPRIRWKLNVSAAIPGVDYSASFDVPVFKTPESDPNFELDEAPIKAYSTPSDPDLILRKAGVQKTYEATGVRFHFPAARRWLFAFWMSFMATVWGGVVVTMLTLNIPILFPIVFGLFELLFIWLAIDAWLYASTVEVSSDGISLSSGLLGLRGTRWISADSIRRLEAERSGSSGKSVYYNLKAYLANNSKVTLAKHFDTRHLADSILSQIEAELRPKS